MGAGPERGQLPQNILLSCPSCQWAGHFNAWFVSARRRRSKAVAAPDEGAGPTEAMTPTKPVSRETLTKCQVPTAPLLPSGPEPYAEIQDERHSPQVQLPFETSTPSA